MGLICHAASKPLRHTQLLAAAPQWLLPCRTGSVASRGRGRVGAQEWKAVIQGVQCIPAYRTTD